MRSPPVRARTLHTPPARQAGKEDPSLHVRQPQWRICFYSPQLSPYAKPDPWILLPVLHIAVPHSFPELPCSSHSSARSLCKTNPFITKQFHPFLDRANTSSPTCVIWFKVLIKSAWQNLSFITWCCLLLLDLLQTSLPRSEPRNCLTCYRAIHNFVTLACSFYFPPPRSSFLGHLFLLFPQKRGLWVYTAYPGCIYIKHSWYFFLYCGCIRHFFSDFGKEVVPSLLALLDYSSFKGLLTAALKLLHLRDKTDLGLCEEVRKCRLL